MAAPASVLQPPQELEFRVAHKSPDFCRWHSELQRTLAASADHHQSESRNRNACIALPVLECRTPDEFLDLWLIQTSFGLQSDSNPNQPVPQSPSEVVVMADSASFGALPEWQRRLAALQACPQLHGSSERESALAASRQRVRVMSPIRFHLQEWLLRLGLAVARLAHWVGSCPDPNGPVSQTPKLNQPVPADHRIQGLPGDAPKKGWTAETAGVPVTDSVEIAGAALGAERLLRGIGSLAARNCNGDKCQGCCHCIYDAPCRGDCLPADNALDQKRRFKL
jgi:hypothetical protein